MEEKSCRHCAYNQMDGDRIWCKFHELQVKEKNYCDYYLYFADAPWMRAAEKKMISEATEGEALKEEVPKAIKKKDILAFIAAVGIVALSMIPLWILYAFLL